MTTKRAILLVLLAACFASIGGSRLSVNQFQGFGAVEQSYYMNSWSGRARLVGGTIDGRSSIIARNLINALVKKSYFSKIKYVYPFLGSNLAAARTPLIYAGLAGTAVAANTNFVEADYSFATGLQGNGTSKILDTGVRPSQIGTSSNGGFGWIENNISFAGSVEPMGVYGNAGNARFVLDLRSNVRSFRWGLPANGAGDTTAATNGRYYGQRTSSTLRELYRNGTLLASNTTSDPAVGAADATIRLVGSNINGTIVYWAGRCACAYLTDGTLSGAEVADLDATLVTYLLTPTGR